LASGRKIDTYRRNVQRSHIESLASLLHEDAKDRSDIDAAVRGELLAVQSLIDKSLAKYENDMVKFHLMDMREVIDGVLNVD